MAVRGKGFTKKHKASGEIPSSSLADIAFLLLIFFMVSTTFRSEDPRQVTMPEAAAQEKIPEKRKDIQHIYIEGDGSVYINDTRIPMNQISDVIGPIRATQPRLVAAIRGDVDVPYDVVNDVQEELRSAGAVRVNFTTTLEREMSRRGR
ncbi:MAG TPA: biopolymer transporter ExbD [Gemmatimonadota bacterium]|nr:biopolymer transporter ExbD [Gemmatimonadota bacterium]